MAMPVIRDIYPPLNYTITWPYSEDGGQDVTVTSCDGSETRLLEVKGSYKPFNSVFWNVDDFSWDKVPSKTATRESYMNGDVVSGVPDSLIGFEDLYYVNAETDLNGVFMPDTREYNFAVKWKKIRDYGTDMLVAGVKCNAYWYVTAPEMKDRFVGYAWHTQPGTTDEAKLGGTKDVRPRLVAVLDFSGISYASIHNGEVEWHNPYE